MLQPPQVPFVATRDGYRREGHCKRLIRALEDLLLGCRVRYLVLPSMKQERDFESIFAFFCAVISFCMLAVGCRNALWDGRFRPLAACAAA